MSTEGLMTDEERQLFFLAEKLRYSLNACVVSQTTLWFSPAAWRTMIMPDKAVALKVELSCRAHKGWFVRLERRERKAT